MRTSETHPLQIASVEVPGTGGAIGVTFCPGKKDRWAMTGPWDRDLELDVAAIRDWGAEAVVTLIESHEFETLQVEPLGATVRATGMRWFHLPIQDVGVPDSHFEGNWATQGPELCAILKAGGKVVVHCRGGRGRAGTIAACLLVDFGVAPDDAIAAVRQRRPEAIETREQEGYVRRYRRNGQTVQRDTE